MDQETSAKLNNKGVALLGRGELGKALCVLHSSLKYSSRAWNSAQKNINQSKSPLSLHTSNTAASRKAATILNQQLQSSVDSSTSSTRDCSDSEISAITNNQKHTAVVPSPSHGTSVLVVTQELQMTRQLQTAEPPAPAMFMHRDGILISDWSAPSRISPKQFYHRMDNKVLSSIITFNIGVVFHLKGLEDQCSSLLRLQKALIFYKKSLALLRATGLSCCVSSKDPIIDQLLMGLYNNLAQIKFELLKYNESSTFFNYLLKFASTILPSTYNNGNEDSSKSTKDMFLAVEELKSKLLLNALILRAPTLAPTA